MSGLSLLTIAGVVVWVVLVVLAQLLTPEQSALSMGMSGLATGRHGWLMKLAYLIRGVTATTFVAAVAASAHPSWPLFVGLVLIAVWGICSVLLVLFDTDMPGDEPTLHGIAHALLAAVGYVAVVVGMLLVSWGLRGDGATAGLARWAGPIALLTAVALFAQFAGFGAAARAAAGAAGAAHPPAGGSDGYSHPAARGGAAGQAAVAAPSRATAPAAGLARYAGLLQRVFLGMVMLWTVVVAAGV